MIKELLKNIFERKPAEDSLFLRMLWLAQAFTCFYLIALVDPEISHLDLFGLKIPLLFVYFWTAVTGSFLSFHYRREHVKWLEWLGLLPILVSCTWFVDNIQRQLYWTGNIDILLPTVHLMGGLFVSHSFELRSRFDFNFSLVLSLILVCFTAALGKGGWFGLGMFVFIVLAATLLLLDCEARTFGSVQERAIDGDISFSGGKKARKSEKTANLLFPTLSLLTLSILFFLAVPRAESLADQISAKFYSFIKSTLKKEPIPENHFSRRVRNPFNSGRKHTNKDLEPSNEEEKKQETSETKSSQPEKSKAQDNNNKKQKSQNGRGRGEDGRARPDPLSTNVSGSKTKPPEAKDRKKNNQKPGSQENKKQNSAGEAKADNTKGSSNQNKGQPSGASSEDSSRDMTGASDKNAASTTTGNSKSSKGGNDAGNQGAGEGSKSNSSIKSSDDALKALLNAKDPYENKNKKSKAKQESGSEEKESSKGENTHKQKPEKAEPEKGKPEKGKPKNENSKAGQAVYTLADDLDASQEASRDNQVLFKVACNRTVFFRQGAFDRYDGKSWHISEDLPHSELIRQESGSYSLKDVFPLVLPPSVPAIRLTQKFQIASNLGRKIIIAGNPAEIFYPGPSIQVDTCGNLKGSWVLVKGIEYTVTSDEALYDVKSMREEGLPSEEEEQRLQKGLSKFLQIPDNQSEDTYKLSEKLTGLNDNWFVQAEKLCNYLRKNYTYSLDKSNKDTTKNLADSFLFKTKSGDCKDFASAFVILCRTSGIPARMVVGYTPGDFDPASGRREIRLSNAHAWGEVYVPNSGWVPFDATPTGTMPSRDQEEERYFSSIGQKVENSIGSKDNAEIKVPLPLVGKTIIINIWELLRYIPALLALLVLSGPISLLIRKALKRIQLPKPMHPASKIYCKLVKDLRPLGVQVDESQTPGEFLDKVNKLMDSGGGSQDLSDAVSDFINNYCEVYFGGLGETKMLEQKRNKIRGIIKR